MIAFHGDPAIKAKYLERVRQHAVMDEIIKGSYGDWGNGEETKKGCAVGCTLHSSNHRAYETELGIPVQLARLQDGLFEALPSPDYKAFPEQFLEAIPVGADLSLVASKFLLWLLQDVRQYAKPKGQAPIDGVIVLFERRLAGDEPSQGEWQKARSAAAADAAADAAYAAAADAAADAAYAAAAYAYAAAADAYAAAADAYAYAAYAAAYAAAAYARTQARLKQRDYLLELFRNAPVPDAVALPS